MGSCASLRRFGALAAAGILLLASRGLEGTVELGATSREAQRTLAALRLGMGREAWGALESIACRTPAGEPRVCLDARRLDALRPGDRALVRLRDIASSERRVVVRLVSATEALAAGLSFPLLPARTLAEAGGTAATVELLEAPAASAVVSLAHELLTHAWRWTVGRPFEHETPGDEVGRDANESEREARRNLHASGVLDARGMAEGRRRYELFREGRLSGLAGPARITAARAIDARFSPEDFADFDLLSGSGSGVEGRAAAAGERAPIELLPVNEKTDPFPPVSLDVKDADLMEILRSLAKSASLDLVADPDVKGTVTATLRDVPWEQALSLMLRSNGFAYVLEGRVLRVGRLERLIPPAPKR